MTHAYGTQFALLRMHRFQDAVYPHGGKAITLSAAETEGVVGCLLVFDSQQAADNWLGKTAPTVALVEVEQ